MFSARKPASYVSTAISGEADASVVFITAEGCVCLAMTEISKPFTTTKEFKLITDEIFVQLKTVDRKLTENEFTTKYLKTSRSYLCNRRNKGRDVSNDVLLNLYGELAGIGSVWRSAAATESNQRLQSRWQHIAEFHLALAGDVVHRLLERAKA
jgi:hypothetical protein